jgi:hypothetical protein
LSFNFLPSVNHMLIHTSCRLIKGIEWVSLWLYMCVYVVTVVSLWALRYP